MGDSEQNTLDARPAGVLEQLDVPHDGEFRRCVQCRATIPAPRRKVCSARCARIRKNRLENFRRARARP